MSRFWGGGASDSESTDEDDSKHSSKATSEDDGSDDSANTSDSGSDKSSGSDDSDDSGSDSGDGGRNRYEIGNSDSDSDSDDDGGKVKVKTGREKELEKVKGIALEVKLKADAKEFHAAHAALNELTSAVDSAKHLRKIPVCVSRALVRLEDALNSVLEDKEARLALNKDNSKATNALKQKFKKLPAKYEEAMKVFREDPIETDEEDDDEVIAPPAAAEPSQKQDQPQAVIPPAEWTQEMIRTRFEELKASRGKRGFEHNVMVTELRKIERRCTDVLLNLEILMLLVASRMDVAAAHAVLTSAQWNSVFGEIMKALQIVESTTDVQIIEITETRQPDEPTADKPVIRLHGSFLAFCERLDDEFTRSLQATDPHKQDYIARIRDENRFLLLAVRVENFYRKKNDMGAVHRIALRRIEKLYYRREELNPLKFLAKCWPAGLQQLAEAEAPAVVAETPRGVTDFSQAVPVSKRVANIEGSAPKQEVESAESALLGEQGVAEHSLPIKDVIHNLAKMLYQSTDERAKTRAMLCEIYNLALSGSFYEARDLMLMSHLQDSIKDADVSTQILFNRCMAQLGLCAFRNGFISDAHSCLAEFYTGGRIKELLAQGVVIGRFADKTPEQERTARLRQLPYHMHINLELLDTVHLVSAMLLEVPHMARSKFEVKRRTIISKSFRRMLEFHDRQIFRGPPENNHDFIMTATNALIKGDVDTCTNLLINLKAWNLLPKSDELKEMLTQKIREEGLRTYLFTYSHMYKSISSESLCKAFHLTPASVHSLVSKMMVNQELCAAWDQPTGCIVTQRIEPTKLQLVAMQYANKIESLLEHNEKMMDAAHAADGERPHRGRGGGDGGHRGRGDWKHRRGGRGHPRQHQHQHQHQQKQN